MPEVGRGEVGARPSAAHITIHLTRILGAASSHTPTVSGASPMFLACLEKERESEPQLAASKEPVHSKCSINSSFNK